MKRILVAAVAATIVPFTFASPAEATRPIVGYPHKDVCKNIKGVQTNYMLIPPSKFAKTKKAGICRKVR